MCNWEIQSTHIRVFKQCVIGKFTQLTSAFIGACHIIKSKVEAMENQKHTYSVFLDLSKSFECIIPEIPLHKLET